MISQILFFAHGVRLDVYLNDENGTHYDIEMQTTNQKDIEKRIRYYQSTIDREVLGKGIPVFGHFGKLYHLSLFF